MKATTIRNAHGGWRWQWDAMPAAGARLLLHDGREVEYRSVGACGMLEVLDEDGSEFLLLPHMVAGVMSPNRELRRAEGVASNAQLGGASQETSIPGP